MTPKQTNHGVRHREREMSVARESRAPLSFDVDISFSPPPPPTIQQHARCRNYVADADTSHGSSAPARPPPSRSVSLKLQSKLCTRHTVASYYSLILDLSMLSHVINYASWCAWLLVDFVVASLGFQLERGISKSVSSKNQSDRKELEDSRDVPRSSIPRALGSQAFFTLGASRGDPRAACRRVRIASGVHFR